MATTTAATAPITERSATALAGAIRAGELRSRQVVDEHIELIERVNPRLNALVADRFEAARAEADAADARVAKSAGQGELPPLLGVPCTIKESFAVAGLPNSAGLHHRRDVCAPAHAVAVERLVEAGAIPLGVTNVSELTLWIESTNRVYGRTNNAYDHRRTAGGSSGGEGAAIGSGFAPFGIGTDFGGSIRIPAFFNGVFGHKPTGRLVPHTGHFPAPKNEIGARLLGIGPLARRAEDLWPVVRALAGPDGVDTTVEEFELGDPGEVSIEGLQVTITDDATVLPVSAELRNARLHAASALAERGALVRRVSLRGLRRAVQPYLEAVRQSGSLTEMFEEEGYDFPPLRRLLVDGIRRRSVHTPALVISHLAEKASGRLPERLERRAAAATRTLEAEVEEAIGDGVLLHPPFARVAPRHGGTVGRPWILGPMAAFNLLGLPATEIPLGLNQRGLPLGVQAAAARGHDHLSVAVAVELERAFGGWVPPRPSAGPERAIRP
jgi:fatty acid amide hydrolase 2